MLPAGSKICFLAQKINEDAHPWAGGPVREPAHYSPSRTIKKRASAGQYAQQILVFNLMYALKHIMCSAIADCVRFYKEKA